LDPPIIVDTSNSGALLSFMFRINQGDLVTFTAKIISLVFTNHVIQGKLRRCRKIGSK